MKENREEEIINWIQNSIKERSANGLILDMSNRNVEHSYLLKICKKAPQNIYCVSSDKEFFEHDVKFNISEKPLFSIIEKSNENNLLTVSPYNFIDLNITKPWLNHLFIWDLLPFGNLFLSDIYELYGKEYISNDLKEYEDVLWAWDMNEKLGNILFKDDPSKNPYWPTLNFKQKQIIANLYSNIKNNKHKIVTGKIGPKNS